MRLLIGWCIRSVLACAVVSVVVAWLISFATVGTPDDVEFLTAYWWSLGILSVGSILYWIADYLIDHDEWRAAVDGDQERRDRERGAR